MVICSYVCVCVCVCEYDNNAEEAKRAQTVGNKKIKKKMKKKERRMRGLPTTYTGQRLSNCSKAYRETAHNN